MKGLPALVLLKQESGGAAWSGLDSEKEGGGFRGNLTEDELISARAELSSKMKDLLVKLAAARQERLRLVDPRLYSTP